MGVGEGWRSVDFWAGRLSPGSARVGRIHLGLFLGWLKKNGGDYAGYTPDRLVEAQRGADNGSRYRILDLVQAFVQGTNGRASTKRDRYSYVRSFFTHNRAELPRDPSFRVRGEVPRVRGELTVEEVRKAILSSKPCYQAVFLCMFQGGMGADQLLYWNEHGWESLREQLREDPRTVKIDLPGRKQNRDKEGFYTFIGGDAIRAVQSWLPQRPQSAKAIFTNQYGQPLKYPGLHFYWLSRLRTLGIAGRGEDSTHRTGRSLHELRDVFRSLWAKSPARAECAEFFMGHSIDPLGYNKSWRDVVDYRREYEKALPWLQIISSPRAFGQVDEEEVEALRNEVQRLREAMELRKEPDQIMNRLFRDPEFTALLEKKLREVARD